VGLRPSWPNALSGAQSAGMATDTSRFAEVAEETTQFRHRSMYPQRERILFSLAYSLHEHQRLSGHTMVSLKELRTLCCQGTKLMDEEVDVLLSVAKSDADGQVDFEHFVGRVSELLQKPSSEG